MPEGNQTFQQVLAAAISDLTDNGFDSIERVARWTRELRNAAERSMVSAKSLDDQLREGLAAIYRRMVERGGALRYNPGVERFTLQRIAPALRAELDRRIVASASLIRLNRDQAIEKTLARFQGWSTSIPPGGVSAETKAEVRKNVKKSLASLPFEERRVLIDQGHKLISSINAVVAQDGGAIAARWRSHWRQPGYDYREDHKERDELVYLIRDSWAHRAGLVKPGKPGYLDAITQPAQEPFCFPGDSRVPYADHVEVAYRRWYDGELATIITDSGKRLRATPNHPVLTPRGWVAIGVLDVGDHVIEIADERLDSLKKNDDHPVATFAEIFGALCESGVETTADGQLHQFHGDGADGDVDVVLSTRPLSFGRKPASAQSVGNLGLALTSIVAASSRAVQLLYRSCWNAASRFMRGVGQTLPPRLAFAGHPGNVGGGASTDGAARPPNDVPNDLAGYFQVAGECQDASPALMPSAHQGRIVSIERSHFSGHVYNLQTRDGWYVTEGIVAHNCRCYAIYLYALRDLPADMLTAKGRDGLAQARSRMDMMSGARADAEGKATPTAAHYLPSWSNAVTRCQRCSMFVRLAADLEGNGCAAVAGEISAHGHCRLFAPAEVAAREPAV